MILAVGTYLVVSQVTEERKISFGGGDPGPKTEVQHKVKRRTTTAPAPALNKRITTTSTVSKIALPDMPNVQLNMGPSIAGAMGSGGFAPAGGLNCTGGAGSGKGGFTKMTFFGLRGAGGKGEGLVGRMYDLKQLADGKPSEMYPQTKLERLDSTAGLTEMDLPHNLG